MVYCQIQKQGYTYKVCQYGLSKYILLSFLDI